MSNKNNSLIYCYLTIYFFTGINCFFNNIDPVKAQIISDQTTNTIVNQNNNQFDITGGILSADQANLFHSFAEFGLNSNQIANFLSNHNIQNILGRITGGNPSYLDGLIQVIGGNSNLYLMNPAGIIFGNNASLNVPADFTATTATGISFGDKYFNGIGNNNYGDLIGNPTGFLFNTNNPGAILNSADLTVNNNQNLMLVGGTVINTGNLTANNGNITITSVPESSKIILSQPGQILSLEINIPSDNLGNSINITPLDLPQLLTGNNNLNLTDLTLNRDGTISTSSGTIIPTNSTTTINTGNINTSSNTAQGGNIYILGNTIGILDQANLDVSGLTGGGNINIGGEYQGGGTLPTAETTIIGSNTHINADAILSGNGGNVIIWSDNYTNFLGNITAKGGINSGNGGFVETSSKNILNILGGTVNASAINGIAGQWLLDPRNVTIISPGSAFPSVPPLNPFIPTTDDATVFADDIMGALEAGTNVTITTGNSGSQEGNITLNADIVINPTSDVSLTLNAANNITVNNIIENQESDQRFNVSLLAGNLIDVNANITTNGGNITLTTTGGSIDTTGGILNSSTTNNLINTGGNITLSANNGYIATNDLISSASVSVFGEAIATGGDITLTSGSYISTGNIEAFGYAHDTSTSAGVAATATGGNVTLTAGITPNSNIRFSTINTTGETLVDPSSGSIKTGIGGNINITANGGTVRGTGTISSSGNTIQAQGTTQGGTINITHDGGVNNDPFIVGNSSINGTNGSIVTGTFTTPTTLLSTSTPNSFAVLPNGGTATGTPSGINIVSVNTPPTISPTSSSITSITNSNTSFTINSLNLNISDVNSDNLTYTISIVNGSITVNGITYNAGHTVTILPTDSISYQPPTGLSGNFIAFKIITNDRVSNSNIVDINYNVNQTTTGGGLTNVERININRQQIVTPSSTYQFPTLDRAREILQEIEEETGVKPAIIYVSFVPSLTTNNKIAQVKQEVKNETNNINNNPDNLTQESIDQRFTNLEITNSQSYHNYLNLQQPLEDIKITIQPQNTDELELVLITPGQIPIRKRIAGITRSDVIRLGHQLQATVTNVRRATQFLEPAQALYQLLISPLELNLQQEKIENLVFIMDVGLRAVPLAALYDGNQFLVEKYSVGFMPSLSLTDTRYVDVRNLEVLAMGAQTFTNQTPLPFVPLELANIQKLWATQTFLNQDFTEENFKKARNNIPYGIIHLATHGEFLPGNINNSYIQFFDQQLQLDQIRDLELNNPPVELLVLSACRTALGDNNAELGFAGFATQAGVKTALGSLWYVSDEGTLALMTNFYQQLKTAPIKAEALRQAQIAMIKGNFITPEMLNDPRLNLSNINLSHPYYWSGFTMVGNPW